MAHHRPPYLLNRRGFGALAAGLALGSGAGALAAAGRDAVIANEDMLTFLRVFAVADGSCALTNAGIIYGKQPGELPRPLCGFLSVLEIAITHPARGLARAAQLEAMVCTTLDGSALLKEWTNVYTGERVIPVGYASPENLYYFTAAGTFTSTPPDGRPPSSTRTLTRVGGELRITDTRLNNFPSGITAAQFPRAFAAPMRRSVDILTHRALLADLAQPGYVPADNSMLTDAPWPLWMMMGKADGHVIWHGFGSKYRTLAAIPREQAALIDQAYPGFMAHPASFPRRDWSTAAQLKRAYGVK